MLMLYIQIVGFNHSAELSEQTDYLLAFDGRIQTASGWHVACTSTSTTSLKGFTKNSSGVCECALLCMTFKKKR